MAAQHDRWISIEEYHELERNSETKYEYSNGHVYAMSGGTFAHSQIAINLIVAFTRHLRGKVCRVANSDMHVLPLGDENPSYLPDVTVTCNPEDYKRDSTAIRFPCLIIEVLSPSTASKDRGEKLRAYQACPSLQEYVMISSHHQEVEVYQREQETKWVLTRYTSQDTIMLASIGLNIAVADIYRDTDLPPIASILDID